MHNVKVTTCCYCGSRAALCLRGKTRHELACGNCGAPLHRMKMMPLTTQAASYTISKPKAVDHRPAPKSAPKNAPTKQADKTRSKPAKRRKSTLRWLVQEAWDVVEDIFD